MEYNPVTLPVSGEIVLVKPISPLLLNKLRNTTDRPKPPIQKANYGTEEAPDWREEQNFADPDYEAAVDAYATRVEGRTRVLMLELGTQVEWTEEKRQALHLLKTVGALTGLDFEGESDKFIYVSYIAIKASEDYNALLNAIIGASRPTEAAIQEGIATFRAESNGNGPDIQGEQHIRDSSTPERDSVLV